MPYDFNRLASIIVQAIAGDDTYERRMGVIIDECAAQNPHPDWDRFRKINFQRDTSKIAGWLPAAFPGAQPKHSRQGLWFGLFNPLDDNEDSTADIYVGVAPEFDSTTMEWACDIEKPNPRNYLGSGVLDEIYKIAYESEDGLENDAEYPLVLGYGGVLARSVLTKFPFPIALRGVRGSAVGFDSGDFLILGEFANGGFVSNVRFG